jgi:hypothetical protein
MNGLIGQQGGPQRSALWSNGRRTADIAHREGPAATRDLQQVAHLGHVRSVAAMRLVRQPCHMWFTVGHAPAPHVAAVLSIATEYGPPRSRII